MDEQALAAAAVGAENLGAAVSEGSGGQESATGGSKSKSASVAAKKRATAAKHKASKQARSAKARKEQHQREAATAAAAKAAAGAEELTGAEDELDDDDYEDEDDAVFDPHALDDDFASWSEEQRTECLDSIVSFLRARCSREGTSPGDSTSLFNCGGISGSTASAGGARPGTEAGSWFAGADAVTAFFLDDFLYSRQEFFRLIDEGAVQLFHCLRCKRVLQGDCRPKKPDDRQKEEAERRQLIASMRREMELQLREQAAAAAAASSVAGSSSSATAAAVPASSSDVLGSAMKASERHDSSAAALGNAFSALSVSAADDRGADGDAEDDSAAASELDPASVLGAAHVSAAESELSKAIAALPPISPWLFPRHNALPRYCRYCHAPSGQLEVRTHMTHSLSVRQMRDMFDHLINPHVDWSEGIGVGAAAASSTSGARKPKQQHSAATVEGVERAPASASVYAVDIGSRLGNLLYAGVLWTQPSACRGVSSTNCGPAAPATIVPRWVGVELDGFFASLCKRVLRRWGMSPSRGQCVEGDITSAPNAALLRHAKLVAFFNCFELHVGRARHRELLRFLRDTISQRGQYILSCPSLHEIFQRADSDVDVEEWVQQVAQKDDAFLFRVR